MNTHTEDALEELKKKKEKNPKDAEIQFYKRAHFPFLKNRQKDSKH